MDNSNTRLQDVFFYGLYMDEDILQSKGVEPRNKRTAVAKGYKLRIGKMATLLRDETSEAYGILYSLTHSEIDKLYVGSGLIDYVAESIEVRTSENEVFPVLCCNLQNPPKVEEENYEYYQKLIKCMTKYKLPIPKEV